MVEITSIYIKIEREREKERESTERKQNSSLPFFVFEY